jgi:hypothetical protein
MTQRFDNRFDAIPRDTLEVIMECARSADVSLTREEVNKLKGDYRTKYLEFFNTFSKLYGGMNERSLAALAQGRAEQYIVSELVKRNQYKLPLGDEQC